MDYEKLYKDALERAKNLENITAEEDALIKYIFPELVESEDERIRKIIHKLMLGEREDMFTLQDETVTKDKVLAYLEKQKELTAQIVPGYPGHYFYDGNKLHLCSSPAMEEKQKDEAQRQYNLGVQAGREEAMYELEKEQKPNIELIQKSWYMEGYHDREFNHEPKWIIKTGEEGPRYEENPKYGQIIEQNPIEPSDDELQRHQKELYDFKVFAAKQAKEHHISFVNDFEWNNFCDELLSFFYEKHTTDGKALLHVAEKSYQIGLRDGRMEQKPDKCKGCNNVKGCITCVDGDQWEHIYDEQKPVSREEILGQLLQSGLITMPDYLYLIDKQKPEGGDSEKPNNQWREDDEKMRNALWNLLKILYAQDYSMTGVGIEAGKFRDWLKSLCPHWKPSDEQMGALKSCFHINPATGEPHSPSLDEIYMLSSLYNDLKKLM